jgi:hypothetical protein
MRRCCARLFLYALLLGLTVNQSWANEKIYDVIVYGGTSGGVAAAVGVRRMGKSVLLIEPSKHLGGLTSGGLGATDIGNKGAIGGISREFYRRVKQHYQNDSAWRWQSKASYPQGGAQDDAMWTFEPHVAEQILRDMAREAEVELVLGERLDLKRGVQKEAGRIVRLPMESGQQYRGRRYIDATYEGDLMALAGVEYIVGREANARYHETLNGIQTAQATKHQLMPGIDPYIKPGDASSGLLPGIDPTGPGMEGEGDQRVQAYNLRMCVTDVAENRLPFEKPDGYDELQYELLLRNFEAGETRAPWNPIMMPNRKTDANNNYGFSTDFIGQSYAWPEGDYATRDRLYQQHLRYHQGLMWTLANHPRVPAKIRAEFSKWGNCKDEFPEHAGWSPQLYVREARQMVSAYVMTQHNCQGRELADDSIGLAAYTMDSHHVQRYVDPQGHARNEGDVQVGGFPPYPIAYRSIVPREEECSNLLVPVCLSASHIAYGSIRMEPVFMVLGQSAATAAVLSLDGDLAVQRVDIAALQKQLRADSQVLEWTAAPRGLDPKRLPGIVQDDTEAKREGDWTTSSSVAGFVGAGYLHDNNEGRGEKSVTFTLPVKAAGRYEVRLFYTANPNRATNVPVTIEHAGGSATIQVNQQQAPTAGQHWTSLGVFKFDKAATVRISNADANGFVVVDAVQLVEEK